MKRTKSGLSVAEASFNLCVQVLEEVGKPLTGIEVLEEASKMGIDKELKALYNTHDEYKKAVTYYFITEPYKEGYVGPFVTDGKLKNRKVFLKKLIPNFTRNELEYKKGQPYINLDEFNIKFSSNKTKDVELKDIALELYKTNKDLKLLQKKVDLLNKQFKSLL